MLKNIILTVISLAALSAQAQNTVDGSTPLAARTSNFKYVNGSYDGKYNADGQREGFGSAQIDGGGTYIGQWFQNLRNGNGKATFSNGDRYEGGMGQ